MKRSFSGRAWLLAGLLGAAAVAAANENLPRCEPNHVESGVEAFGTIVTFTPGQEFRMGDLTVRALAADAATPAGVQGFLVKTARERQQLRAVGGRQPVEFQIDGKTYVLELAYSILFDRPIRDNEMVVWPKNEYHAHLESRQVR